MRPFQAWIFLWIVTTLLCSPPMPAEGVPPGRTLEWDGNGGGAVVFDGTLHSSKGAVCTDCHPKLFMMKQGSTEITMKKMFRGEACGGCHNGERAFDAKDLKTCRRCHRK